MPLLLFKGQVEVKVIVPIKAALADRKKVVKTGSIFMGRGRVKGRGSAESRLRGMGRGSVGAWLRGTGRGSAGEEFRGMGRGLVGARLRVRGSSSVGARLRGMAVQGQG